MTGAEFIEVRVPAAVYRALYPAARQRGVQVGELLTELAVAQLQKKASAPAPNPRAKKQRPKPPARVPMTDERLQRLIELHGLNYSLAEIAQAIGVSRANVHAYVTKIRNGEIST